MRRVLMATAGLAVLAPITAACSSSTSSGPTSPASTASGTPTTAAAFSPQVSQQLQTVVSLAEQQYQIPGIVAAVSVPGQGSWTTASGQASTSPSQPVSVNSAFWIGSITKTFTGTVILQLVQQGKLSLTSPISQWEPSVQNANTITVQMLLNMTSGIFDEGGPGSQVAANPSATYTPQQIVDLAVAHGPAQQPGQFYYSDTNYAILGIIAQDVAGQPIQSLISSQILGPLHLTHTSYPTATPAGPSAPLGNGYVVGQGPTVAGPTVNPTALGAAGAMISTVGDLQVWAKALATGSLLSPVTQQQRLQFVPTGLTFPPLPGTGASTGLPVQYGLGISSWGGLLGHNGQANAYTSDMLYLPAKSAAVIVLANGYNPSFATTKGENVSDAAAVSLAQIVLPGALQTAPVPTSPSRPVH
jgi:D-alanyl-D-alanine carboxypeptidase